MLLKAFLLISPAILTAQIFNFSRQINPFEFMNEQGKAYEMPFLGGFNVPRIQFVDIDLDGDADLFVQERDGKLIFFENTTSTTNYKYTWRTDDWFPENIGAWYRFVDVHNDGDFDLFCQGSAIEIQLYINQDNVFTLETNKLTDISGDSIISELTSIPEFHDIDCDGDLDLFLGRQTGTITFYENIASRPQDIPQFKFITDSYQDIVIIGGGKTLAKTNHHGANSLAFGDLNNDGPAELLYGDFFSRSLYYFENVGSCDVPVLTRVSDSFPVFNPIQSGGFNTPELFDIDNDGDQDLFISVLGGFFSFTQNVANNFYFYENFGDAEAAEFFFSSDNFLNQFDAGEQSVPVFIDIDADDDLDLFVGNQAEPIVSSTHGQLLFFENTGSSSNPQFVLTENNFVVVENMYNYAPAFADLDGDNDFDLMLGRNNGKLAYFENSGSVKEPQFILIDDRYLEIDVGSLSAPSFADLDGDGDFDMLIGEFDGNLNYFENSGDKFNPQFVAVNENFAKIIVDNNSQPYFVDFNEDGLADLLVGSNNGAVHFFENNSSGQLIVFNELIDQKITTHPKSAPALADIDKDGDFDLISGTAGGGFTFYRNDIVSSISSDEPTQPASFYISQNYPNPFNNKTNFKLETSKSGQLIVEIFNINGKCVKNLLKNNVAAGSYDFSWDGYDNNNVSLPSGVYIVKINFDLLSSSRKIVLLK